MGIFYNNVTIFKNLNEDAASIIFTESGSPSLKIKTTSDIEDYGTIMTSKNLSTILKKITIDNKMLSIEKGIIINATQGLKIEQINTDYLTIKTSVENNPYVLIKNWNKNNASQTSLIVTNSLTFNLLSVSNINTQVLNQEKVHDLGWIEIDKQNGWFCYKVSQYTKGVIIKTEDISFYDQQTRKMYDLN